MGVSIFSLLPILGNAPNAQESTAASENVRELRATHINPTPPKIDGVLDDKIWQRSDLDLARDFIQREPDEGTAATESTVVAIAYDDDALYFAFWCYDDEPEKIARQLVRRDRWGESDIVTVRLDPYHDHQTGYRFDLSAAGVQRDCRLYDDEMSDYSWDGVWESGVKMQPWGWSAEIRIPYHCLRFAEKEHHTWGMNVTRYISRRGESPWWAFSPSSEGGFVSRFGHLTGLEGIKPTRHIEVLPYAVSGLETQPKSVGNPDGRDYMKNVGFDLKYGLSSNLILDATINPDFGQVELDQPVLNLSTYETYYEEKRPFFVEGANLFNTPYTLFYSRRIGRPPRGSVDDPDFDYYLDYPKSTTILGAAKLTGKLNSGTSIAFLDAVTQEENADYRVVNGDTRDGVVEPSANYTVFRVQQDLFKNSKLGGMYTSASQDGQIPVSAGGVDWRLMTNSNVWGMSGQTVFSRLGKDNTGYGIDCDFMKNAGEHIRGSVGFNIKDRNLDLNRLGYLGRNNWRGAWAWLQYRTNDDWWIFRNTWNNFNIYGASNYEGYNIDKGGNYNTYIDFINYWSFGGGIGFQAAEYEDRETRGNGVWDRPDSWSWWASLNTDTRKKISLNLNPGAGKARYGSWWAHWTGVTYRPAGNIEFNVGTNISKSNHQIMWVENVGDSAIFADMNQDELVLSLSTSITLTRDLSLQLSGQGYISGINYSNYRRYLGGENYAAYDLGERDFNYSALNSTFILRWEYIPGSTIYAVWTRAKSDFDNTINDLEVKRDLDRLFSGDAENVFLVKVNYWWNL